MAFVVPECVRRYWIPAMVPFAIVIFIIIIIVILPAKYGFGDETEQIDRFPPGTTIQPGPTATTPLYNTVTAEQTSNCSTDTTSWSGPTATTPLYKTVTAEQTASCSTDTTIQSRTTFTVLQTDSSSVDTTAWPGYTSTTPLFNNPTPRRSTPASTDRQGHNHSITFGENYMLYQNASVCDRPVILKIKNITKNTIISLGNFHVIKVHGLDANQISKHNSVRFKIYPRSQSGDHNFLVVDGRIEFSDSTRWTGMTCRPQPDKDIYEVELGIVLDQNISCPLQVKLSSIYECTK